MKAIGEGIEIKRLNRIRTIKYILDAKKVSRQDIAAALGFSMPTVLQNVADLIDCGLVCEAGEYGSSLDLRRRALCNRRGGYRPSFAYGSAGFEPEGIRYCFP